MDQTKLRKSYAGCKQSTPSDMLPSAQKSCNKKKGRHKGNACQANYPHSCDMGFTPFAINVLPQTRIHPSSQRLFQTTDTSICHYPVPMNFPLEHVSVPFYSTLLQAGTAPAAPLESVVRINRTSERKIPAMFQTLKQNNDIEQDYTSLPPVNCHLNTKQPKDDDSACKRRFSDPGLAQISSEECSNSRSSESSNNSSLQDLQMPYAYGLIEQVNELRENNSDLTRELHEVKLELESLKLLFASWRPFEDNLQPGKLSDLIVEVRDAIKAQEQAMMAKITNLYQKNSAVCNEMQRHIEEKLMEKVNERMGKLEEEMRKVSERVSKPSRDESPCGEEVAVVEDVFLIQQQLVDSEREKISLRKELQEAIDSRKEAEACTQKFERLVSVLRNKINGVTVESCMGDEKPAAIRPLSSSFEQNLFIRADNINSHKNQQQKRSLGSRRIEPDVKENCTGNEGGGGLGSSEGASIPQVTITGPVTDL